MSHPFYRIGFALLLVAPAARGDWNQFRGPTGQGLADSDNLPVEFGPGRNVAWKKPVPGLAWSSPAVVGGRVYLTTAVPDRDATPSDHSLRALCLDGGTGETLWNVEVFREAAATAPRIHEKNSHASPSPVVEAGKVYVHFGHMGTACLSAADGKRLWDNRDLAYAPVHGNGGSPIVVGDDLAFSIDGTDAQKVVALDKATGRVRWQTPRNEKPKSPFSFGTPTAIAVGGKELIVSAGSGAVMALDAATGKEVWRVRYPGGYSVIPKPAFAGGLAYVCTGYTVPHLLAIDPSGKGDVTATHVAWTVKKNVPHSASLLPVGDDLYMVSDRGVLSCLEAKTGKERWNERVGGNYSASPILAGGLVYLLSEEGVATVFKPGDAYEPIAKNKLDERALASPAVDGDALHVRTAGHLYKFRKE